MGSALASFREPLRRVEEVAGAPNRRGDRERNQPRGPGRGGCACLGPGQAFTEAGPTPKDRATWARPDQLGTGDN